MDRILTMDSKNYTDDMPVFEKNTVRAIICRNGLYAMQQSGIGEYKIPGGGVESGESHLETIKREVLEETGLIVIEASIKEIGEILETRQDIFDPKIKYVCHSYFYYCDVEDRQEDTHMTQSEIEKGFHPVWVTLEEIISRNAKLGKDGERDTVFIDWLLKKKKY